jgi:hypothetical protein
MRLLLPCLLCATTLLPSCKRRDTGDDVVVTSGTCLRCDAPRTTGTLASGEMDETSGLAASSRFDGVYFANNDSGDTARFFAVDATGRRLATFVYAKGTVFDCEDIARGPCDPADPSRSCLFIGDIGDNGSTRHGITVYRVAEPGTLADTDLAADALPMVYPDGPHDAETLLVHPVAGVLTIVTKVATGASSIYEARPPLVAGSVTTLVKVGTIVSPAGSPRFTGGDVGPKGILLRTYTHAYFVPMRSGQSVAAALGSPLCSLPVAREEQGEAIAWTRSGDGFMTTSEGRFARLSSVRCDGP